MKKIFNFLGWFLLANSLVIGIHLDNDTKDVQWKVGVSFILFLIGIFIIIKTKDETTC